MHTSCTDTDELLGVVSLHTKYAHIMYWRNKHESFSNTKLNN